jgi:hypothetical protein
MSDSLANTKRKTRKPRGGSAAAAAAAATSARTIALSPMFPEVSTDVSSAADSVPEEPEFSMVDVYPPSSSMEDDGINVPSETTLEQPVADESAAAAAEPEQAAEPDPVPTVPEVSAAASGPLSVPLSVPKPPPQVVFIVPYRDREAHYRLFSAQMQRVMAKVPNHQILYIHQTDSRSFNRGAMKNIGFLVVKQMYPDVYRDITLIFNDVDSVLSKPDLIPYRVRPGTVHHFYGFRHTLGGIVGFNAADFEKVNGFPNFWTWGYEDNLLQMRAQAAGLVIKRDPFFDVHHPSILRMMESNQRTVNREEFNRFARRTPEGIRSISNLTYQYHPETGFVDVLTFDTDVAERAELSKEYDLVNGNRPFAVSRRRAGMAMHFH